MADLTPRIEALEKRLDLLTTYLSGGKTKIASGKSKPTDWGYHQVDANGVEIPGEIDLFVDTKRFGFKKTPLYFLALNGDAQINSVGGAAAVYDATKSGFRVTLNQPRLTLAIAQKNGYYMSWIAIGE